MSEITAEMLRDAYTTLHAVLDDDEPLPFNIAQGLSHASIICALLYPSVIGCRPGEDRETMKRLG